MDQDQDTVQVLLLETPCSPAWRTRLQSHLASSLYDLSFPPATSLFCQHMRRPLLPSLRRKMHSAISCPGLSDWSGRATALHLPVTSMPVLVQIVPPGPVHLVRIEWGTWMKTVNICLSYALPSTSVLQTRILLAPWAPKSHGCTLILDGGINSITWSWGGDSWTKSVTVTTCILRTVTDHALVRCKLALGARKFHLSHSRPSPSIDCSATKDPVKIKRFQTLFCNHLNSSSPAPKDHEDAWAEFCTAVTDSDVIAFGRPSRKQPDWFCDSADLLLPALEAKHKARAMVCTHDTRNARLHLTSCKTWHATSHPHSPASVLDYLSQRIHCCADTGDLHSMYQGIKEAIGLTSKKTVLSEACFVRRR